MFNHVQFKLFVDLYAVRVYGLLLKIFGDCSAEPDETVHSTIYCQKIAKDNKYVTTPSDKNATCTNPCENGIKSSFAS